MYLISTVNITNTIDNEIFRQIKKASNAFLKLGGRLWSWHGISNAINLKLYNTHILASLLYTCGTCATFQKHEKTDVIFANSVSTGYENYIRHAFLLGHEATINKAVFILFKESIVSFRLELCVLFFMLYLF